MSSFTLTNVATDIDSAISRVASADTTPTANSQSMVTSGGIKTYVDGAVTPQETSADGITDTDGSVPTSAAVKDYVTGSIEGAFKSGLPELLAKTSTGQTFPHTWTYTAPASGLVIINGGLTSETSRIQYFTYGATSVSSSANSATNYAAGIYYFSWSLPAAPRSFPVSKNQLWTVQANWADVLFKSFETA